MHVGQATIVTSDDYLASASITAGPSSVVNISTVELGYSKFVWQAEFVDHGRWKMKLHTSVNVVYDSRTRRYAKDNRTEFAELYAVVKPQ